LLRGRRVLSGSGSGSGLGSEALLFIRVFWG
jgi:hypothetical protein